MSSRARRAWSAAGISGTAALLAAAGGATWYYANRLTEPPALTWPPAPKADDRVEVVAVREGEITLTGRGAGRAGVWGIVWVGGYGRVGDVIASGGDDTVASGDDTVASGDDTVASGDDTMASDDGIARPFSLIAGEPPETDGPTPTPATLDAYAYPADPSVLGAPWEEVVYDSPVGDCPAWWFPGERDTCVVLVHGRSARRHEAFRMLPTVLAAGLSALVISYRNDPDAPRSADGRSHLGATEWEDVEAAVRWALEHGATDVIPVGFSMGGACVVNFAALSSLADRVRGMILEAPVLDWGPVIRAAAIDRGLPPQVLSLLLPATMRLASARVGIDWAEMRHDPAGFRHPKLLIHGTEDVTVPVELADAVAEARPDIVTYLRVEGAGHVRSWNADPDRYAATVADFLDVVLSR